MQKSTFPATFQAWGVMIVRFLCDWSGARKMFLEKPIFVGWRNVPPSHLFNLFKRWAIRACIRAPAVPFLSSSLCKLSLYSLRGVFQLTHLSMISSKSTMVLLCGEASKRSLISCRWIVIGCRRRNRIYPLHSKEVNRQKTKWSSNSDIDIDGQCAFHRTTNEAEMIYNR